MLIVDAQVHIWGTGLPTNPAHRQITSFLAEDLLKEMDEAGVDAALIHPPGWDPNSNQLAIEAARQHPNRLSILGNFPLDRPESRGLVPGWKQNPGMLGLRFSFQGASQENWPTDGTMDWLWPAVAEAGIPVALMASGLSARGRADCGASPRRATDRRPLGAHPRRPGRSRMGQPARPAGLGEAPQRGHQGDRRPQLLQRPIPLQQYPRLPAPDLRRLWPGPNVLGHRHHPYALFLAAMRHHVHRRIALALRRRQGTDNGPRPLQLDRVGPSRLRNYLKAQCGTQQTRYSTQPVIPAKAGIYRHPATHPTIPRTG